MILATEVKDPRIDAMISVVDVETSGDLRHAKVFISVYGDADAKRRTIKALASASGFVSHLLGDRLSMRSAPRIHFTLDDSIERGAELSDKILQLKADRVAASNANPSPDA